MTKYKYTANIEVIVTIDDDEEAKDIKDVSKGIVDVFAEEGSDVIIVNSSWTKMD